MLPIVRSYEGYCLRARYGLKIGAPVLWAQILSPHFATQKRVMVLVTTSGNWRTGLRVSTCMSRIIVLLLMSTGVWAQATTPYPNELPDYRFYQTAKWRTLTPTDSTIADVRLLLGNPDNATDLANTTDPYPGDDHVTSVVFTYSRLMRGWDVLIYLHSSCGVAVKTPRLCSVDLLPHKRTPFAQVKFPGDFVKKHVTAVDAAWDEYSDGSGLRYEVYSTKTPYGNELPGDLNRISYGQRNAH